MPLSKLELYFLAKGTKLPCFGANFSKFALFKTYCDGKTTNSEVTCGSHMYNFTQLKSGSSVDENSSTLMNL